MIQSLLLFPLSLILLWLGSGLAVTAVTALARYFRVKSFFVSFFVLGVFTSITELTVGINSFVMGEPEIYVGNLIGSSVVVFLFVIPLLSILGNGIRLSHTFSLQDLTCAAVVVGLPALLTIDNNITRTDALLCIAGYILLAILLKRHSTAPARERSTPVAWRRALLPLGKLVLAVAVIFAASKLLVSQTVTIGRYLGISPYIVSMLVLSVGTNIPELSIGIRSVIARKKDIALGNYVGSAALNTLEIGVLSLFGTGSIPADGSNYSVLVFGAGLAAFLLFAHSRNTVSRLEGAELLCAYFVFIASELSTGPGWNF